METIPRTYLRYIYRRYVLPYSPSLPSWRISPKPHNEFTPKYNSPEFFFKNRTVWHLAKHTNVEEFIAFLTKHGLVTYKFRADKYGKEIVRYSWGKASLFELAVSFKPHAYLCHATAATLHGLAKPKSKAVYLNVEQSTKLSGNGSLTQEGISRHT